MNLSSRDLTPAHGWMLALALAVFWPGSAPGQPAELWGHSAIYDPVAQRMIVFGGYPFSNATWHLSLDDDPRWEPSTPAGALPAARFAHSAVHDPVRGRMVVFGGRLESFAATNGTWVLTLASPASWDSLQPTGGAPSPRAYHSAIYDPVRDRIVVFGGVDPLQGIPMRDVWSLWLSPTPRWEAMAPRGPQPLARHGHVAIFDPDRDRMLVFGGGPANDVWALSFADTTWSLLQTSGTPPQIRSYHSAVYDPQRKRMIAFGGNNGNQNLNDVWELTLSAPPTWTQRSGGTYSPTSRQNHSAVCDTAFDRMLIFGGAFDVLEPTWALSLGPAMRWSPARAVAELSPSELVLPGVTLGDTVSTQFIITSGGLDPLQVSDIRPPARHGMLLSVPAPLQLGWNEAVTETLRFVAAGPGAAADSIVIVSNDPLTPRRSVSLTLEVLALDFTTRVLDEPAEVPLGAAFVVVVTPDPGVRVERGTLFYRVAGGASPFDSLALTPLATDFIASVPAASVTERGVEYYVRVENSGFVSLRPAGAPATVFTQAVARPDAMTGIPRPTSGSEFLAGREIEVEVVLPAGAVFVTGTLHYRVGGAPGEERVALAAGGVLGRPIATIPADAVGPRGVEYWVEANTLTRTLRYPASGTAVVRTRIQNLVEPAEHAAGRYRLLTVPLDFGDDFSGNLYDLLADQLGTYDPVRWRAYRFDGVTQGNVELSSPPAEPFRPEPGRAFWLVSRDPHRVDTKPIAGTSTPTGGAFAIPLRTGWNLIGNPFDFPVAWADVGRNAATVGDPVAFDPALGSAGDYADATPLVLAPFDGYFVHAMQPETLSVPPREASPPSRTRAEPSNAAAGSWQLRLRARSKNAVDGANTFGVVPGADAGPDALDGREPPLPPGPWVQVAFVQPEWGGSSGLYRRDLRAPGAAGETWEVEVRSGAPGEAVTLEVAGPAAAPGFELRLVDREQGIVLDGSAAADDAASGEGTPLRYTIVSMGPRPYRLAIVAGTPAYVDEAVQPAAGVPPRLALESSAPNPFRLATRIRFALPRTAEVDLEIFNVLGQRVAAPLRRARLGPGYHSVVWDGTLANGSRAPSGMYLLRLAAGGDSRTGRLVLVR